MTSGAPSHPPHAVAPPTPAPRLCAAPRDAGIETLRGLAIFLVVAFHAVERGANPSVVGFHAALALIRLPLFAAVAGFVYALRPVRAGGHWSFVRGKARRLLLPIVSLSLLEFFLKLTPPFVELPRFADVLRLALWPRGIFWFLEALFLVFVLVAFLDRGPLLTRPMPWLAVCVLALGSQALAPPGTFTWIDRPWAIDGVLYLLGYFLLGVGIRRFGPWLRRPGVAALCLGVALAGIALAPAARLGLVPIGYHKGGPLSLAVGCSTILLLFAWRRPIGPLAALGGSSMALYLFHGYAFYAAEVIERSSRLELGDALHYGLRLACGLALPLLAERLLRLTTTGRALLLGERRNRHRPAAPTAIPQPAWNG